MDIIIEENVIGEYQPTLIDSQQKILEWKSISLLLDVKDEETRVSLFFVVKEDKELALIINQLWSFHFLAKKTNF